MFESVWLRYSGPQWQGWQSRSVRPPQWLIGLYAKYLIHRTTRTSKIFWGWAPCNNIYFITTLLLADTFIHFPHIDIWEKECAGFWCSGCNMSRVLFRATHLGGCKPQHQKHGSHNGTRNGELGFTSRSQSWAVIFCVASNLKSFQLNL